MPKTLPPLTKIIGLVIGVTTICFLCAMPLRGATTDGTDSKDSGGGNGSALHQIAVNTYGILTAVNNLPTYMQNLASLALAWMNPDTTNTTSQLQSSFSNLDGVFTANLNTQLGLQTQLSQDLFGSTKLPINANDLTMQTLLGFPFVKNDPRNKDNKQPPPKGADAPFNYIENAAGVKIPHPAIMTSWSGSAVNLQRYYNYYNSVMAAQSFGGYVMSGFYADAKNNGPFTTAQQSLITQASNSTWFATVASEQIGIVLRQILMFQSQSYLMLTQMLATEKQLLAATVINNTLTILTNLNNEKLLVHDASGQPLTA